MIKIKRAYLPPEKADGFRILVDRLWPRGISKEKARLDCWLKDVAPSNELRKWFSHDPDKWLEFQEKYKKELRNKKTLLSKIKDLENKNGTVTLVYAAKNEKYNNAIVLKEKLEGYRTIITNVSRTHGG